MTDSGSSDRQPASTRQPQPSIYDRLMPLMYALIGAASAMFLHTLFCGRPVASRGRCPPRALSPKECECPPPAKIAVARPAPPAAPEAVPVGQDKDAVKLAEVKVPEADRPGSAPVAPAPASPATPASRPAAKAGAVEDRLAQAIRPCVRARARSFRLAVRLHPDGAVRRVFVARDTGVNAVMTGCITRKLENMSLPVKRTRRGYAEWRVRRADGQLSLNQVRPRPRP